MKKQSMFIVVIAIVAITLAVGYSVFKTNVEVVGKSAVVQDLDVIFSSVGSIEQNKSEGASAVISDDKKTVKVNVPRLLGKGAFAIIPITIKNNGTIPAKLYSINEYGFNAGGAIKVEYNGIGVTDVALNPGDTTTFTIMVTWENDLEGNVEELEFAINFNYVQA